MMKRIKTIAIDIDGVLTDIDKYRKEEGAIYFGRAVVNEHGKDIDELFGVTKKQKDRFWREKYRDYIIECPAKSGASISTHKLASLGYRILIVTARHFKEGRGFKSAQELELATEKNLLFNEIYFDELRFVSYPKISSVHDYEIDIFIDDDINNIETISKHIPVLIMDASYNRALAVPNTTRVYSWDEVVDAVEHLDK